MELSKLKNSLKSGGSVMSIVDPAQDFDMTQALFRHAREPVDFLFRVVEERRDGESRLVEFDCFD